MTPAAGTKLSSYTVDASVAFKWFAESGELELDRARRLQALLEEDQIILHAPDLIVIEVANALRYKSGVTQAVVDLAVMSLSTLASLELHRADPDLLRRASAAAFANNLSFYDACYVAVSQLTDTMLLTADRRLLKNYGKTLTLSDLSL